MASYLATLVELIGAILIVMACWGVAQAERVVEAVVWPFVSLFFGVVLIAGSTAAVAAVGAF